MKKPTIEELFPVEDWREEVANGDTKLGLEEWRKHRAAAERTDDMEVERRFITRQSPGIVITKLNDFDEEYSHPADSSVGGPSYKLDLGKHCNDLMDLGDELMRRGPDVEFDQDCRTNRRTNHHMFNAIHAIVDQVAEFEQLDFEPEEGGNRV